jgi:hypothetical protein
MATIPSLTSTQLQAAVTGINMLSASSSPPPQPVAGMVYFHTLLNQMMIYTGQAWVPMTSKVVYNLFIDDIRNPDAVQLSPSWLGMDVEIVRTVEHAYEIIRNRGLPERISFDHDLGEGQPPATHIMWHIINGHLDEKWDCSKMKEVMVHSVNTPGADNLLKLWRGFCNEFDIVMDTSWKPALK